MRFKGIILIVVVFFCSRPAEAAPDVKAKLSLVGITQEATCGLKVIFGGKCRCRATYQIDEILQAPEQLGIEADDIIALKYPCDKNERMVKTVPTLQWAEIIDDGSLIMTLPSHYLEPLGLRRWLLKNEDKIFGPVR